MANKVMQADASAADAWAEIDLGSGQADIWITERFAVPAATLTAWLANAELNAFTVLYQAGHAGNQDYSYVDSFANPALWGTINAGDAASGPSVDAWALVEFHHQQGVVSELYVDGALVVTGADAPPVLPRFVRCGLFNFGAYANLVYYDDVKIGTTRGAQDLFHDDFESGSFAAWTSTSGAVSIIDDPFPPPPPPTPAQRFPNGTRARMVVTDLGTETTAWLDRLLLEGTVNAQLNLPWQITGAVRSSDPQVNRIFVPDFDPRVAQSNRLVYVFLRDGPPSQPWQCRASGILMSPEDQGDADIGTSHFTAYDPWQYLFGLPCFLDGAGGVIGPNGRFFPATSGAVIAAQLLADTITSMQSAFGLAGFTSFIDAGLTYAGTAFYTGTLEATPLLDFTVQQGMTLGDAWNQLVASGDPGIGSTPGGTGGMDIVLEPIYDPVNRPGYCSQLSIYNLAGSEKALSPMAWGRFSRTATTADRQNDGTPGNFINVANFHVGQGGLPVPAGGPPPQNTLAVNKYGPYWQTQFFPSQVESDTIAAMETQTLILHKQGKRTFVLDPDPIRAKMPFRDYTVGDRVRVMTTDSLRVSESGFHRVEGIPLVIGPDGVTRVNSLLVTPDWRQQPPPISKVLKADASTADAYASKDFGADYSEVWVSYKLAYDATSLAYWTANSSGYFSFLFDNAAAEIYGVFTSGGAYFPNSGASGGGSAAAGVWQLLEYHYLDGTPTSFYVDGVLIGSDGFDGGAIRSVLAGQYDVITFPSVGPNIAYIDDYKVGTTRGGGDIFADNFESGDLSAWTTTTGSVSIVPDPF